MNVKITDKDALIVVDMQKDFMPGGVLEVEGADEIIPYINGVTKMFEKLQRPVFFSRDWHPKEHISFVEQGGRWPEHCIAGSKGARFDERLYMPKDYRFIISKGTSKDFDAYSAFEGTLLENLLKERGIKRLFVCGVATDFCVKHTVLGALNLDFVPLVLKKGIKGVTPKGEKEAVEEMLKAGAIFLEGI